MNELLEILKPHDTYHTPDDNTIHEWQFPNGHIARLELSPDNNAQIMISFPDRPSVFIDLTYKQSEYKR